MRGSDLVAYMFEADLYCETDLVARLIREGRLSVTAESMPTELALDQLAGVEGIDRENERSFDSDDFPKPVLREQCIPQDDESELEEEYPSMCGECGCVLAEADAIPYDNLYLTEGWK